VIGASGTLNARILGDPARPPIILLHGWGGSIASVAALQDRLSKLYYVHALDLPGFGATPPPPIAWDVADYAAAVIAYMDSARLSRVHLIGHSFGGRISVVLGADYPTRIHKIVLTSTPGLIAPSDKHFHPRRTVYRSIRRTLNAIGLKTIATRVQQWYWNRYASDDYKQAGVLKETFIKVVQQDLAPYARRITASTLLIWGDQDQDAPLWQGQQYEKLIADAGLVVMQGVGHFAYLERPTDFTHIVETFFAGS